MSATTIECPQCGKPVQGSLCAGVCPQCMASSMLGEWADAGEMESPPDELVITRVADYDVLRVLGRGGMGVVCRARDRLLGRDVALKLMHSGVLASDEELRRFRIEAETVAKLRHTNLVEVYEAGESDGQAYYTMTLAEGGTLAQKLHDSGPMEPHAAAKLVECIAYAVHHAHTRGVLHRDLKPANIVFDADGTPMVSDFGLARLTDDQSMTRTGSIVGTPAYIAPEVASGEASHTTSSDIYALGVILFECLTGKPPFDSDSPLALLKMIAERDPPSPSSLVKDLDGDLDAVVLRALEKSPSNRYATAEAFAQDLAHWRNDEPVSARAPAVSERFWRWAHRNQSRAVLYTMAAVSLIILVVASAVMNILLARQQSYTEDQMHQSQMRRAILLRDFASRLMQSPETVSEAKDYLTEASEVGTPNLAENQGIGFRLRILQRLEEMEKHPLPKWTGDQLEDAWFDTKDRLMLRTREGVLQLSDGGVASVEKPEDPPSRPTRTITIDGEGRLHFWLHEEGGKEVMDPMRVPGRVRLFALSTNGRFLATVGEDGMLRFWEMATRLAASPPISVSRDVTRILWDSPSSQIALIGAREVTLFAW